MNSFEFDSYAKNYHKGIDHKLRRFIDPSGNYFIELKARLLNTFFENLLINKKQIPINILDFGCGLGEFCKYLKHKNRNIFGLDLSYEMIKYAKTNNNYSGVYFLQANGNEMPLREGIFDVIFASCVFHHIENVNHEKIISEMKRVCKKDGMVCIFEHNPNNLITQLVVRTTPIDRNAKLQQRNLLIKKLNRFDFVIKEKGYLLFGPKVIDCFLVDHFPEIMQMPFGGQYYINAINT